MNHSETETHLRAVINSEKVAVLCFHSTRSAYSRRTVQILTAAEGNFPTAEFCLVDADQEAFLPLLLEFGVVGLPTILIFRSGVQAKSLIGERSEKSFTTILNHCLNL